MNILCKQPARYIAGSSIVIGIVLLFILPACKTPRQAQYLQGPIDTAALSKIQIPETVIQKGDLIGITVFSDNPDATAVYNQQISTDRKSVV